MLAFFFNGNNFSLMTVIAAIWHRWSITEVLEKRKLPPSNLPKWLFSCVCSNVLPQVTVRCEVFTAAFWFTVKCFPCVKPLMCFQPKKHAQKNPFYGLYYKPAPLWGKQAIHLNVRTGLKLNVSNWYHSQSPHTNLRIPCFCAASAILP